MHLRPLVLAAAVAACTTPPASVQIGRLDPAAFDPPRAATSLPPAPLACIGPAQPTTPEARIAACTAALASSQHSPGLQTTLYRIRSALLADRRDLPGALADAEAALRLDPTSLVALLQRGEIRHRMGDDPGALADYNEVIARMPTVGGAYLLRAAVHARNNRHALALADANQAVALLPTAPNPLLMRGYVLHRAGRLPAAIADLDQAVTIAPTRADIRNERGLAHVRAGNRRLALADFAEAARLDPTRLAYVENLRIAEAAGSARR